MSASNNPSTAQEYVRLLNKEIVARWGGRRLSDISRRDVNMLLDDIVERGAPIAANRVLAILRKFCKWAVSREIIATSPCDGVIARSIEISRDRVLDNHELALTWEAAGALGWPFQPVVRLLIATGARRGEVVGMRWEEIDLEKKLWSLPAARTKNKRPHALPLSSLAIDILNGLPRIENDDGLVFPAQTRGEKKPLPVSGFSKAKLRLDQAIAELAKRDGSAPLAQFGFHDLRRSCASGMARLGVDLHVIERCLNHISGSFAGIVSAYQKHKFEEGMRRAMDAWAARVKRLAGDAPGLPRAGSVPGRLLKALEVDRADALAQAPSSSAGDPEVCRCAASPFVTSSSSPTRRRLSPPRRLKSTARKAFLKLT